MRVIFEDSDGRPLYVYAILDGMALMLSDQDREVIRIHARRRIVEFCDGTKIEDDLVPAVSV